jgi:hypothetical protein
MVRPYGRPRYVANGDHERGIAGRASLRDHGRSGDRKGRPTASEQASSAPRITWHGLLGGWLASPLAVTVVAALLGSWLIPQLTRGWQDHQKALEIKTGLVGRMSESVSDAVARGRFIAAGLVAPGAEQREWNGAYRAWTTSSAAIGATLRAYTGAEIGAAWQSYADAVTNFLLLSADTDPGSRR